MSDDPRLRSLMEDVARLAAGWRPDEADLSTAPFLDDWYFSLYPGSDDLCLCGRVRGHPRLVDGLITTSPLVAISVENGWVRTCSRFYRLGRPDRSGDAGV